MSAADPTPDEQAARIRRIHRLARQQLDQGAEDEELEALVLLAHLRPGRGEEALFALKALARDVADSLGGRGVEPVYPCFVWTGELLCLLCGYLEGEGWAYDYTGAKRWMRREELFAHNEARKAAEPTSV